MRAAEMPHAVQLDGVAEALGEVSRLTGLRAAEALAAHSGTALFARQSSRAMAHNSRSLVSTAFATALP